MCVAHLTNYFECICFRQIWDPGGRDLRMFYLFVKIGVLVIFRIEIALTNNNSVH